MQQVSGNIYIRPHGPMSKGFALPTHAHHFDHTTICFYGSIMIRTDRMPDIILLAPHPTKSDAVSHFLVPAGVKHEIVSLEEGSMFWCVFSHRNENGEVLQQYEGTDSAYGGINE